MRRSRPALPHRRGGSASKLTRCHVVSPLPLVQVYEGESVINRAFATPQTVDRGGVVHSGTWQSAVDTYQLCHEWRAEDAPLAASQAAPGPLSAMRAVPPPLPERPSDLLPLAAARPGYMSGAFHGRARRMHGASAHHTDHDATGGNAIPAATE